jgi:hypothetical protein
MKTKLSPAARAQIADAVADVLDREAAVEGSSPRLDHYAVKFRELGVKISAQLGRTGAWREARSSASGTIAKLDEMMDYWLDKLYDDLEADTRLVLNDPARARRADELLDALFPLLSLAALVGLRPDREVEEIGKLVATANTANVRAGIEALGLWPMIDALASVLDEQRAAIEARKKQVRSETPEGTATEIAAGFEKLWRQFSGFLSDAYDEDVPTQAALVDRLRAPYDAALAKLEALARAAASRRARAAEAEAEQDTTTIPPPFAPPPDPEDEPPV